MNIEEAKKKLEEKQKKEDARLKKIAMNEKRAELIKAKKELEEDLDVQLLLGDALKLVQGYVNSRG